MKIVVDDFEIVCSGKQADGKICGMLYVLRTLGKTSGRWTCPNCWTVIQWKIKAIARAREKKVKEKVPDFSKALF